MAIGTIKSAARLAIEDAKLARALRDLHKKDCIFTGTSCPFMKWLEGLVDKLSVSIENPTAHLIVEAMRVNAIGDSFALLLARCSRRAGLKADVSCYVEEGVIHSAVWQKGSNAEEVKQAAEDMAAIFRKAGYATDVYVDEEDEREVTVNAQIDFSFYLEKVKEGGK